MLISKVTTGRRCCSARRCVRRGSSGASRQQRLSVRGYCKTHTQLWIRCVYLHTHTHSTDSTEKPDYSFFLMCCVFRSPSSCSSVSSRSGSSSMWSSHCDRRRGASWEKVWMYWKTCWDNQMNCCHANLMLTPWADVWLVLWSASRSKKWGYWLNGDDGQSSLNPDVLKERLPCCIGPPSKMARLSSTPTSEPGKGQRQCTEHLQDELFL